MLNNIKIVGHSSGGSNVVVVQPEVSPKIVFMRQNFSVEHFLQLADAPDEVFKNLSYKNSYPEPHKIEQFVQRASARIISEGKLLPGFGQFWTLSHDFLWDGAEYSFICSFDQAFASKEGLSFSIYVIGNENPLREIYIEKRTNENVWKLRFRKSELLPRDDVEQLLRGYATWMGMR